MCGIAGVINRSDGNSALQRMLNAMHHRGPDDSGTYADDYVAIGMNRLAILDLSPLGHQPMQSHCKRYWIVYNGECYNYRQIRKKLERAGEKFVSNSDTEVVLQAYVQWGANCLKEMNGMFAFAIWDTQEKMLFAGRDRLGIKPFYYAVKNNVFFFGSEIKALLSSGDVDFNLDPVSVFQYFTLGYIQQPNTIINNVFALLPAHYLIWKHNEIITQCYWDFSKIAPKEIDYSSAKEALLHHIKTAVGLQMVSDRPVGIFLSGGLDSASVLASMAMNNANVKSYSLAFKDTSVKNEGNDARELATHFGIEHQQVDLELHEVLRCLDHYFDSLDQPSTDGLNTFLISKFACRDITVALSGLGGDELFLGYSWQRNLLLRQRSQGRLSYFVAQALSPSLFSVLLGSPFVDILSRIRNRYGFDTLSSDYINLSLSAHGGLNANYKLLSKPVQCSIDLQEVYRKLSETLTSTHKPTPFVEISYLTSRSFMLSQLLRDMDAVSMAHSIEVRFPLIDHELFEFAVGLPDKFKVQELRRSHEDVGTYATSTSKRILLDTMLPYLPQSFLSRRKNGFKLPLLSILNQIPETDFKDYVFDSISEWGEWLDTRQIQTLYNQSLKLGSRPLSWWKILTFARVLVSLRRAADTAKTTSSL